MAHSSPDVTSRGASSHFRGTYLNSFFHEIGHTLTAQHSGTTAWEYGDCSSVMGCTSFRGCMDAPNAIALGWATPLASHFSSNVTAGVWYPYSIPTFEMTDANTVRVRGGVRRGGEGRGVVLKPAG